MVRRLLALRQYIEMRSEMRRMSAPKAFKKPWKLEVKQSSTAKRRPW